jgi:hypothetical protein
MLSAASVEDDDCASIAPPSEVSGSSSANSHNKKRSRIGSVFKAFQFHLMIKTDLRDGTTAGTAVEKEMLLKEHLRASTGHKMPPRITGLVVFCDRSLFSQPPDSDGLVSIEVLGYVQAKSSTPLSTMEKWINSATWKPVEGGLTSDDEYMSNMRRFEDPDDQWTRLLVYGSIGANNVGRAAEKAARKVEFLLENWLLD